MKVTKGSCDVTPRSKYQKSKGHPWSPCASNLVQFRLLFTKLRHFEKNGTRNFSLIGRHLESVSRTIPVFKHGHGYSQSGSAYKQCCNAYSQLERLCTQAVLQCLIRRAALHISSVKMAYLQSIRRTSTCSKSNISQRRQNR